MDEEQAEQLKEDFDNLVSLNHKMIETVRINSLYLHYQVNEVLKTQGADNAKKDACSAMLKKVLKLIDNIVDEVDDFSDGYDSFEKNMGIYLFIINIHELEKQIAAAIEARRKRMAMADEALRQHEMRLRARQQMMDADKEREKTAKGVKLSDACKKLHETKDKIKKAIEDGKLNEISDVGHLFSQIFHTIVIKYDKY